MDVFLPGISLQGASGKLSGRCPPWNEMLEGTMCACEKIELTWEKADQIAHFSDDRS